jgi:hypothetical protein
MEDNVDILDRIEYVGAIPQIPLDQLDLILHCAKVPGFARGKIIQYANLVAAGDQRLDYVGSNKPRPSGNKSVDH